MKDADSDKRPWPGVQRLGVCCSREESRRDMHGAYSIYMPDLKGQNAQCLLDVMVRRVASPLLMHVREGSALENLV